MELINNTTKILRDDLAAELKTGSRLSIAAACFSIYAFQELKAELQNVEELRFIFTSPTFTTEKAKKEKREFYKNYTKRPWSFFSIGFAGVCVYGDQIVVTVVNLAGNADFSGEDR